MRRREILRLGAVGVAWFALTAHTPYRQWKVYRQKHLLIGSCRTDPLSYPIAGQITETLLRWLPESSPRSSRAPNQRRIASLLASDQWQVAVLRKEEAIDLAAGRGLFEPVGAVPVHSLFAMGDHLLICRFDFPEHHAWLVAATLSEHPASISGGTPAKEDIIPLHPGAQAYAEGHAVPNSPLIENVKSTDEDGHTH